MVTHRPLQRATHPALRGKRGFTLIELIISIVLIGLLAAVGTTMISDSFDTTYLVNSSQSSTGRARYAMERLEREIREGKTVTPTSATVMTVTNSNGANVVIASSGGALTVGGATLIANEVVANPDSPVSPLFKYLEGDGTTVTALAANVRYVQIYLTVRDPTSGQTISQRTRVALRNAL